MREGARRGKEEKREREGLYEGGRETERAEGWTHHRAHVRWFPEEALGPVQCRTLLVCAMVCVRRTELERGASSSGLGTEEVSSKKK